MATMSKDNINEQQLGGGKQGLKSSHNSKKETSTYRRYSYDSNKKWLCERVFATTGYL